jgi:hypothetical protein
MKFELKPYNRDLSDDELLDDLKKIAAQLSKDYVTKDEYDQHGRLCSATFAKRFGSWGKSHELAGLRRVRNFQATAEDCIADIQQVASKLNTNCITNEDYKKHGKFSLPLITKRVGSWKTAIERAGLNLSEQFKESITEEALFENLEQLWEKLGRQPSVKDFVKPLSQYSYSSYPRRFGSYRKALEAFITFVGDDKSKTPDLPKASTAVDSEAHNRKAHRTSRNISWRMCFLVMRRDNFRCCFCGKSPATDTGIILHVDHKTAWAEGGETEMGNLQTLCQVCNIGKSNLPMHDK